MVRAGRHGLGSGPQNNRAGNVPTIDALKRDLFIVIPKLEQMTLCCNFFICLEQYQEIYACIESFRRVTLRRCILFTEQLRSTS